MVGGETRTAIALAKWRAGIWGAIMILSSFQSFILCQAIIFAMRSAIGTSHKALR